MANTLDLYSEEVVAKVLLGNVSSSSINYQFVDDSITKVGIGGLYGLTNIKYIDLPNLTEIECGGFANITAYSSSIDIFSDFPWDNLTKIDSYAFAGLAANTLYRIVKGDIVFTNLTHLGGAGVFYEQRNLTSVSFPSLTTIIPFTIGTTWLAYQIRPNASSYGIFASCTGLLTASFPIITNISSAYRMFQNCLALTTVSMPNVAGTIPEYTFYNCSELVNLNLGSNVNTIGRYAFNNCRNILASYFTWANITSIDDYAFYNCSGFIGTLDLSESPITSIGSYAFRGTSFTRLKLRTFSSIYSNSYRFNYMTSLQRIDFGCAGTGNYCTGSYWFRYCTALTLVVFHRSFLWTNSNTTRNLFTNCTALTTAVFKNWTSMLVMQYAATNSYNPFYGTPIANGTGTIYVPDEYLADVLANSNWASFVTKGTQILALSKWTDPDDNE